MTGHDVEDDPALPIIDVEASGFGRGSYPIEIGVALPSGRGRCFLIRPEDDWIHWDPRAASLHGLSRSLLDEKGLPVGEVARALNELLDGSVVYTDAWGMDSSWIALLYERAGILQRFRIETLATLLDDTRKASWTQLKAEARAEMRLERHRASADALVLQLALRRAGVTAKFLRGPSGLSGASPGSA